MMMKGAALLGLVGFAGGFFGPMLFMPDANQGPMLGIFITGFSSIFTGVNFMVTIRGKSFSVAELAAAGVKRISFASSLYRAAMTGFINAAREIKEQGTFTYLDRLMPAPTWAKFMTGQGG